MTRRLLLSETLDPDGALFRWISADVQALGWQVARLPTQEAIHLLGPATYAHAVADVVREWRPHLLLVHPPYDHLSPASCAAIRDAGTRLCALCFDDPLFASAWGAAGLADLRARFDLWATTDLRGPAVAAGATPLRWAISPESLAGGDPEAPAYPVLLVGRHTPQREAVVYALLRAGHSVGAFGAGWPAGPVSRDQRLGMSRRAGVIITPNDGVDMVKARLLEAAALGVAQAAEAARDVGEYLDGPTWQTPDECVAVVGAARPPEAPFAHTWTARWPELVAHVALPRQAAPDGPSPTLCRMYAAVAHAAEGRGAAALAGAVYQAWAEHAPGDRGALAGLARAAYRAGRYPDAARLGGAALDAWRDHVPAATAALPAFVPSHRQGAGLGQTGALDPTVELEALRLSALLESGDLAAACAAIAAIPVPRRAVLAGLLPADGVAARAPFWKLLGADRFGSGAAPEPNTATDRG